LSVEHDEKVINPWIFLKESSIMPNPSASVEIGLEGCSLPTVRQLHPQFYLFSVSKEGVPLC
jgi:hypothetical protein